MSCANSPHKVVQVLQDGRVYVLDTGQKVHFERLKPHQSGPLEFVATRAVEGDIEVLMDPEHPVDVINDGMSPIPSPLVEADPLEPEASHPTDHSISRTRYLPQLFSDHVQPRSPSPQLTATENEPSLLGTSSPLLKNTS